MPFASARRLSENAGLAYIGERVARLASIPDAMADRMLRTPNRNGRPNADVVRQIVGAAVRHRLSRHWQIDFPSHMSEHEAACYEHPYHHLHRTVRPTHDGWWINPHVHPALRAALARRERFLATPFGVSPPEFSWFESSVIPDDTLLAVARDDDFMHGMLQSRAFVLWWNEVHSRRTPTLAVDSFPFPWPPATELNALTAAQEENRHAISRAARGTDAAALNAAVCAAYGWPPDLDDAALLDNLATLNRERGA
jgi:hypothetical protein